jgi:hypothetical protein
MVLPQKPIGEVQLLLINQTLDPALNNITVLGGSKKAKEREKSPSK